MTPRTRWLLQQVKKGIVRADYTRWSIMRPSEHYRNGSERNFSIREQQGLLDGRLVEIKGVRVHLTQRGEWLLNTIAKAEGGAS